jgi:hypothetical protein
MAIDGIGLTPDARKRNAASDPRRAENQVKPHPGTRVQFLFVSDSRVQRVSQGVC